jgi:LysM repeat protein
MNVKFGLMAGAAIACAVMAGCKAPKAQASGGTTMEPTRPVRQTELVTIDEKPTQKTEKPAPFTKAPKTSPRCTCAPGTTHDKPCTCGAPNCKCKVVAPEPEYTVYRVKGGDMLSAICKTYGVRQKKVLELNPGLDPNKLYAGRKIKLPGKVELKGDDATNAAAKPAASKPAAKPSAAKAPARASSYKGATKEYKVKNGDFLGKIAAENGITVKCLKEMNGLQNNNIRVGQKLKVPAEKPVVEAKPAEPAKPAAAKAAEPPEAPKSDAPAAAAPAEATAAPAEPAAVTPEAATPAAATPAVEQVKDTTAALEAGEVKTHTVKENEDVVSIAIQYGVSPSAIMDLNDLKNGEGLPPGRVLKLPANAKMQ